MADTAPDTQPAHMPWEEATVVAIRDETARAKTFRLALRQPSRHMAGQHYIVRLTAPDGYTAMRSYSVASPPDGSNEFELTVELLPDGEVSSFLHEGVVVGDQLEVRGPIGGWFVWNGTTPALGIGGGSGVVPIMSMLRLARRQNRSDLFQVVVSVRSPGDLYYASEIEGPETTIAYTREAPPASSRPAGRLRLPDVTACVRTGATTYICGSTGFTNAASDLAIEAGVPVNRIRVERFGPTG
jgi:ferredoxin-NADP reductase